MPLTLRNLIVMGGSAGSVPVLREIIGGLPPDLPAAILIVVHQAQSAPGVLPWILGQAGSLPAAHAVEGQIIEPGRIYVAPPDHHLLIEPPAPPDPRLRVRLSRGPKENRFRPAIDPLFRTAARAAQEVAGEGEGEGVRVIGVVLSGLQDDGSLGLIRIKQYGGIAIVQDPAEAECPEMPSSALRHARVDHVCRAGEIAALLTRCVGQPLPASVQGERMTSEHHPQRGASDGGPAHGDASHGGASDGGASDGGPAHGGAPGNGNPAPGTPGRGDHDTEQGAADPAGDPVIDVTQRGDHALTRGTLPGAPSGLTCPQCGGTVWELHDGLLHYRCHVGHRYTADSMAAEQESRLESTLWAAMRMFEENGLLHQRMAKKARAASLMDMAARFEERARESEQSTDVIRRLLLGENAKVGNQ